MSYDDYVMALDEFDALWSDGHPAFCRNRMAQLLAGMHSYEARIAAEDRALRRFAAD